MSTPIGGLAIRDSRDGGQVYRTCGNCGERKPLDAVNYYRSKAHFSGYELACKACKQARYHRIYKERYAKDAPERRPPASMTNRAEYNQQRKEAAWEARKQRAAESAPVRQWRDGLIEPHMIRAHDPEFSAYDRPGGMAIAAPGW